MTFKLKKIKDIDSFAITEKQMKLSSLKRAPNEGMQSLKTPYFITDLSVVHDKVTEFNRVLPDVDLFYAVKANNGNQIILDIDSRISGYDVASLGEIKQLVSIGVDPARMLYSNPVKIPNHIAEAYTLGVKYFAFDSLSEIDKLKEYAPGSNVYLRIKVSDYGSQFPLSKKFGVDQTYAIHFCSLAQDAGLNVVGIAFHVGSQSENTQVWKQSMEIAMNIIEKLKTIGIEVSLVDIGGGFPADYGNPKPTMLSISKALNKSIEILKAKGIRIVAEPGRYMVAESTVLVSSVIGREHRSGTDWLYLDVGTFQGLIEPLEMSSWRYPISTNKNRNSSKKEYTLTGPTCDACDTLGDGYVLPSDMQVGDTVKIESAGAYTIVYGSNFNGFEIPTVHYTNSKKGAKNG